MYVNGLAKYLKAQGHYVRVVAGMPPEAFTELEKGYEDDQLKTVSYSYNEIDITGVVLKNETTREIYKKFREAWVNSWSSVFASLSTPAWDIVHLHAHTSVLGEALVKGLKLHSEKVKVFASYHVPVSCSKGTLLFGAKLQECNVQPAVNICAACILSTKSNFPFVLSKMLMPLLPVFRAEQLPVGSRLKSLVSDFIASFTRLDQHIHEWHIFSRQIQDILLLNGIEKNKLFLLRHGADELFFDKNNMVEKRKNAKPIIFLFASRFTALKGFDTLVKAWCSMEDNVERQLWLAGEEQAAIVPAGNSTNTALLRKDIKWLGAKTQAELALVMQQVHCLIIPSEWLEIGPLVFHEAIAAGCDVIASDIGGCKELASFYTIKSRLFEAGNPSELARAIVHFKYSGTSMASLTNTQNFEQVYLQYMLQMKTG